MTGGDPATLPAAPTLFVVVPLTHSPRCGIVPSACSRTRDFCVRLMRRRQRAASRCVVWLGDQTVYQRMESFTALWECANSTNLSNGIGLPNR